MQIDLILEPDLTPAQVAEIAVAAEQAGVRTLWHSNYHQNPDAFVALVPAALATRRIRLGALALSPYEMLPLKIGNALLTLNELSGGRAVVAIGSFWAWHIKEDAAKSLQEARRELVYRGELLPPHFDMPPYATEDERRLVISKWQNFQKAYWTRSGVIEDVPADIVERLVAACSSAAVIVSSAAYHRARHDLIVMPVTSQLRVNAFGDLLVQDWQAARLLMPSAIKPVFATLGALIPQLLG